MDTDEQVFAFRLNAELFCLPIRFVRAVVRFDDMENSARIERSVRYNDILIPLIDLIASVSASPMVIRKKDTKQVVLVDIGNVLAGICVDETCGIFTGRRPKTDTDNYAGNYGRYVCGLIKTGTIQLNLIDLEAVMESLLPTGPSAMIPGHCSPISEPQIIKQPMPEQSVIRSLTSETVP